MYSYTKEAFGRDHAFLCSWFLCLSYLTIVFLNASALFIVVRTVFGNSLQTGVSYLVAGDPIYLGEVVVTILALMSVGVLYILAKPALQYIHTVLTVILFVGAAALALICMPHASADALMSCGMTGAVISAVFVTVQIVPRLAAMEAMGAQAFLMLSLWCLLGFAFYWRTVTHSTLSEYSGMSVSGIVLFALLIYSALLWLAKTLSVMTDSEAVRLMIMRGGFLVLLIIFVGLTIMLYIQNLVRSKHEAAERDKIRAVESSLAKSQFLFNMSHDIRTPMNAILGYTNLARKETDLPRIYAYLEKINGSSQHLLALINDILEMSRIESGKIELEFVPVDLRAVFDGMRDLFDEQMKQKNLAFQVHTGQVQDPYVWADRKNLNRVLLNLLSNAYKFTPEGGAISAALWEAGAVENGYASYEIRVQDTGIGMSKEFSEKIFNAFERERTSTVSGVEGTGLGMSITKSIVDLMGGTIEVLTAPGSGTEIIIRLKFRLAEEKDVPKEEAFGAEPARESEIDFSAKRLLLVEDNAINMEIAILAMTANAFKEDERAAMDVGMQAHIAKPIDVGVMMKTLSTVLAEAEKAKIRS